MQAQDLTSLFARAEQAFLSGRVEEARRALVELQRGSGEQPVVLHLLGLVEKKRGALDSARAAFEKALRLAPNDPQINCNFANLLDDLGDQFAALAHYDRALASAPSFHQARFNRALVLHKLGRSLEALDELDQLAGEQVGAQFHSARGSVLRSLGRLQEAASAYDAALALDPNRLVSRHGRARVAMERGEDGASALLRQVHAARPTDHDVLLDLAEALELEGDPAAIDVLAEGVAARPEWAAGQRTLARMRWEAGEGRDFTRDLSRALADQPKNRDLWLAYVTALGNADLHAEAADAAAEARKGLGPEPELMLAEAIYASEAGQTERADRRFAAAPVKTLGNQVAEARHRIRCGDYQLAARLLDSERDAKPWDIEVWALTGLVWRLIADPRAQWLLEQPGLVDLVSLPVGDREIDSIAACLRGLHRTRAHPIGQSLRGGTQTRGMLFERGEPQIVALRSAIFEAVQSYWSRLPAADEHHPLLRHRNRNPRIAGSWSVRLTDGGFHVAHYHPQGVVSSACYLVVPETRSKHEGWLEIGGPPSGLDVPVGPLRMIEPAPGRLALFPSYMFHGTRPFTAGERLTCAFDIVVA